MRGFFFGLVAIALLSFTVLAARPGGIRRQLRLAGRRLRIVLVLGGVYVVGSLVIRLLFTSGPVADYAPIALGAALAVTFIFVARDPTP